MDGKETNLYKFVQQDPILFSGSIAENIAFGDGGDVYSHDDIVAAGLECTKRNYFMNL